MGALKGGERGRFDFDYPAKIHFLLVMTGQCILEITASLLGSPRVIIEVEEGCINRFSKEI